MERCRWSLWAECAFLLQALLKITLIYTKGETKRFPCNSQWVGRGMGGSWPGECGLGHVWETYMRPKLFLLLACLSTTDVYWLIEYEFLKETLGSITNFHRNLTLLLYHEAIPLVKVAMMPDAEGSNSGSSICRLCVIVHTNLL
jgi:hypothetical protein